MRRRTPPHDGLRDDSSGLHWLTPKGIDESYAQLVWQGFACAADNAADELNEIWRDGIERRLADDGLHARFCEVTDGVNKDIDLMLARLTLPDGTLPPNPHYWRAGNRARVRFLIESFWGDRLDQARSRFESQAPLDDAWSIRMRRRRARTLSGG